MNNIFSSQGINIIEQERLEQVNIHGYDLEHDLCYTKGQLANAAVVYALDPMGGDASNMVSKLWPWDPSVLKLSCIGNTEDDIEGRIKDLAKAGALIAAEIDRLLLIQQLQSDD